MYRKILYGFILPTSIWPYSDHQETQGQAICSLHRIPTWSKPSIQPAGQPAFTHPRLDHGEFQDNTFHVDPISPCFLDRPQVCTILSPEGKLRFH